MCGGGGLLPAAQGPPVPTASHFSLHRSGSSSDHHYYSVPHHGHSCPDNNPCLKKLVRLSPAGGLGGDRRVGARWGQGQGRARGAFLAVDAEACGTAGGSVCVGGAILKPQGRLEHLRPLVPLWWVALGPSTWAGSGGQVSHGTHAH